MYYPVFIDIQKTRSNQIWFCLLQYKNADVLQLKRDPDVTAS